jgi:hypothetical protein
VWFNGAVVDNAAIGADGGWSSTFDTGAIADGAYMIMADVPYNDPLFGTITAMAQVWVDEDPADVVVTSPVPGQVISSGGFFTFAGRTDPLRNHNVQLTAIGYSGIDYIPVVHDDGTFSMTVPGSILPFGTHNIAVGPYNCYPWTTCGIYAVVPVTVGDVPPAPAITTTADQPATAVTLSWAGPGSNTYDVRYRGAAGYVYPSAWQNTARTGGSLTAAAGATYCFSARGHNAEGLTGAWSAERCARTPYDDRWLTVSRGAARKTGSSYYRGTATVLAHRGTAAHSGVGATQVAVVALGGPKAGTLTVTLAGHSLGKVNLHRATNGRVTVWLPAGPLRTGTLTLTASATGTVTVDGVYTRR